MKIQYSGAGFKEKLVSDLRQQFGVLGWGVVLLSVALFQHLPPPRRLSLSHRGVYFSHWEALKECKSLNFFNYSQQQHYIFRKKQLTLFPDLQGAAMCREYIESARNTYEEEEEELPQLVTTAACGSKQLRMERISQQNWAYSLVK